VERGGCFLSEEMRNARDAGDVYTHTSIHACICVCMCKRMCVWMCACVFMYWWSEVAFWPQIEIAQYRGEVGGWGRVPFSRIQ